MFSVLFQIFWKTRKVTKKDKTNFLVFWTVLCRRRYLCLNRKSCSSSQFNSFLQVFSILRVGIVGLYSISTTAKPIYKVHIVPSQSRSLQRELFVGRFNGIVADLMEFQRAVELGIGAAVGSDYIGSTSSATPADVSQYRMTAQSSISNRHAYITNPHLTNQSINQQTSKGPLKTQIPSIK